MARAVESSLMREEGHCHYDVAGGAACSLRYSVNVPQSSSSVASSAITAVNESEMAQGQSNELISAYSHTCISTKTTTKLLLRTVVIREEFHVYCCAVESTCRF